MNSPEKIATCCACGVVNESVRNIIMLHCKAPKPGKGWGCVVCHLPNDGALAVVCDDCIVNDRPVLYIIDGYLSDGQRLPFDPEAAHETHDHNPRFHPEMSANN